MDLQSQKAIIIERFKHVEDENLIQAIKNLLDFAQKKERELYEIPKASQDIVMERFEKIRKEPEKLLDWDDAKKKLKT
jgi:hypothetical protein